MYTVELTGRAGAVFKRDGRQMDLDGELMASGDEWVLYGGSVGIWADGARATPDEVQEIIHQVIDALLKEGVRVTVE